MSRALLAGAAALVVLTVVSYAQEKGKVGAAEFSKKFKAAQESAKADASKQTSSAAAPAVAASQPDDVMESIWCPEVADQKTRDVCWRAYQARMNYYIGAMDHRAADFWWQHVASRIIFVMVIGLVCIGVYFAWVQFRKDLLKPSDSKTDLELSPGGLKLSSPVLGVVILGLSLGFFYLYLRYVFPIADTF